jgi:hypothetical protein
MKTILEELQEIAKQCKTSEEFTGRAKTYLREVKGIKQDIMTDSAIRDIFRETAHKIEVDKCWETYDNTILPMLHKREDCKGLWYEVWIDLDECWEEKWFASFRYMADKDIVEVCAKYLNDQERFYDSPDYYDMLDRMVKDVKWESEE